MQLEQFREMISAEKRFKFTIIDLIEEFKLFGRNVGAKLLLPQVLVLAKLLLVMPATNATSERCFSAMNRIKTYLRNSTSDNRLNHLMFLHVHSDKTDNIKIREVTQEFVRDNQTRLRVFGRF